MPYNLNSFTLNDNTEVSVGKLLVIVGGNNVGKSRALRDLKQLLTSGNPELLVIKSAKIEPPDSLDELKAHGIEFNEFGPVGNESLSIQALSADLNSTMGSTFGPGALRGSIETLFGGRYTADRFAFFAQHIGGGLVAYLGTETRLSALRQGPSRGAAPQAITSILQWIYAKHPAEDGELDEAVFAAFQTHIRLDYSALTTLKVRVGNSDILQVSPDPRIAQDQFASFELLDDQGDGIRSFTMIAAALKALKRPLTLIDEPEAFLHPAQAVQTGLIIASSVDATHQIVITTHSSDLLTGILRSGTKLTIVRLDRTGELNRATILSSETVSTVSSDPLLGSARILDGLFCRAVVVTEADADEAFYARVAAKLGWDDVHYTHAHNKQTIPKVLEAYTSLGVPCAGIVDFDVLREAADIEALLKAKAAPEHELSQVLLLRAEVADAIGEVPADDRLATITTALEEAVDLARREPGTDASIRITGLKRSVDRALRAGDVWAAAKANGLSALPVNKRDVAKRILDLCATHGIFILPHGELESWLVSVGIPNGRNKREWIVQALTLLQNLTLSDPDGPGGFIQAVHRYLLSPTP